MHRGFTILELLIVVTVILALMGMSYPILDRIRARSNISATSELIQGIAAAMAQYRVSTVTGTDGKLWPAWTLGQINTDGVTRNNYQIDGDPTLYPSGDPLPFRAPLTYSGFVNMTGFTIPWPLNAKGQLVDRWHQPINVINDAKAYGTSAWGIWSNGPDQQTNYPTSTTGTSTDDIVSWKGASDQ